MVESYGTGIKRIQALYRRYQKQPVFESATGAFKTTIYNLNETGWANKVTQYQPNKEKELILNLAIKQKSITRKDVENALAVGSTKAYSLLTDMCNNGILIMQKAGNRTCYLPHHP